MINKDITSGTRLLLACGAIAASLFVVAFLVLGLLRPAGYATMYTVSALAAAPLGYYQQLNFFLSGFFMLAFAAGLRIALADVKGKYSVVVLFFLAGMGLLGSGLFRARMPGDLVTSATAYLHYGFALLLFLSLPVACFILLPWFRQSGHLRMLAYSRFSLAGVLIFFLLMVCGIAGVQGFTEFTGLFQRISISIGFAWVAVLSVFLLRRSY